MQPLIMARYSCRFCEALLLYIAVEFKLLLPIVKPQVESLSEDSNGIGVNLLLAGVPPEETPAVAMDLKNRVSLLLN